MVNILDWYLCLFNCYNIYSFHRNVWCYAPSCLLDLTLNLVSFLYWGPLLVLLKQNYAACILCMMNTHFTFLKCQSLLTLFKVLARLPIKEAVLTFQVYRLHYRKKRLKAPTDDRTPVNKWGPLLSGSSTKWFLGISKSWGIIIFSVARSSSQGITRGHGVNIRVTEALFCASSYSHPLMNKLISIHSPSWCRF